MAKRKNKHPQKQQTNIQPKLTTPSTSSSNLKDVSTVTVNQPTTKTMVQPEQMSLTAHQHVQTYLGTSSLMEEKDLTAILRLSTHLRVYGLLSAVGYINQTNDQGGEVRQRTIPVWRSLLGQLIANDSTIDQRQLMEQVKKMADKNSTEYMQMWRKALKISHYWNFWGRAYKE